MVFTVAMGYAVRELMALVCARALRDGDVVVTGTSASLPRAACDVARASGKPRLRVLIGATGTLDPKVSPAPASGGDQAFVPGRLVQGLGGGVEDQLRGFADVIFLGGLQLDGHGRCNLAVVGDYARPRLRGPGSIGLSMVATVRRTFMVFNRHDPRLFVERVDFISGETLRSGAGDALLVVTPLAVMGSRAGSDRVQLISAHPGVSAAEVQARTGFALNADGVATTPPPSEQELALLRSSADGKTLGERYNPQE